MKGIIIKQLKSSYFTDLKDIFNVLDGEEKKFNWLISNYECNHYPSDNIPFNKEIVFLSGEELSRIVYTNNIQFIWGVFSGFKENIDLANIMEYPLPFADGNTELWDEHICIQNPLADIEIIAWDSSLAIVIAKDESIIDNIKKHYPNTKDLVEYNTKQ